MPVKRNVALMLGAALSFCAGAHAQMVVHAVSGKITAVNVASKTVDLATNDGSTNQFKLGSNKKVSLNFGNDLRADSVDPDKFQHVGDFVVVYYYGYANDRTAVAVKDLGAGPFEKMDGTVVGFDKKSRVVTLKDAAGKPYTFALSEHLIVDTGMGVGSGRKYEPHKGDPVRVTYTQAGDQSSVVFVRLMGLSS